MKTTKIILFLFLFVLKVGAQHSPSISDRAQDSLWIKRLIEIEKGKRLDTLKKYSVTESIWVSGKVIYSPDSCLRIGQVSVRYESGNFTQYVMNAQYLQQNKFIGLKIPVTTENYDFRDFPITNIYKMPSPRAAYLILSGEVEMSEDQTLESKNDFPARYPTDEEFKKIAKMYYSAGLVHVDGDSLKKIEFKMEADEFAMQTPDIISDNSIYLESDIQNGKHPFKPFLKYDSVKKELRFLTTYKDRHNSDNEGGSPYVNVYSRTFEYLDTAFALTSDTAYFYPSLELLNKTIGVKKFQTGNYTTEVVAVKKFEDVGEGVIPVLQIDYNVGSQKISSVNHFFDERTRKIDLKPEYKVQNDSGLIFLVQDVTTPNRRGNCGSCEYCDSKFWLIKQNSKKELFSFSSNSGSGYTTYTYNDDESEMNGRFYLKSASDDEEWDAVVDKTYWKDNSTYVVRVSDETLARNFYIHFVTINTKITVKVVAGKLEYLVIRR